LWGGVGELVVRRVVGGVGEGDVDGGHVGFVSGLHGWRTVLLGFGSGTVVGREMMSRAPEASLLVICCFVMGFNIYSRLWVGDAVEKAFGKHNVKDIVELATES
jgi:hypothetical protein